MDDGLITVEKVAIVRFHERHTTGHRSGTTSAQQRQQSLQRPVARRVGDCPEPTTDSTTRSGKALCGHPMLSAILPNPFPKSGKVVRRRSTRSRAKRRKLLAFGDRAFSWEKKNDAIGSQYTAQSSPDVPTYIDFLRTTPEAMQESRPNRCVDLSTLIQNVYGHMNLPGIAGLTQKRHRILSFLTNICHPVTRRFDFRGARLHTPV